MVPIKYELILRYFPLWIRFKRDFSSAGKHIGSLSENDNIFYIIDKVVFRFVLIFF